jgi:translation initiation factor IF-2
MSDGNDNENRGGRERAPLTLKPRGGGAVNAGTVKQSFSHGRTKTVVVETKRRRVDAPGPGERQPQGFDVARPRPAGPATPAAPRPAAPPAADGTLSSSEMAARQRALEAAREAQERRDAEIRAQEAAHAAEAEARRREAEARVQAEHAAQPPSAPVDAPAAPAAVAAAPAAEVPDAPAASAPEPSAPERPTLSADQPVPRASGLGRTIERPAPPGFAPRSSGFTDRPRSDSPGGYSARPREGAGAGGGAGYGARSGGGFGGADRPRAPPPRRRLQQRRPP